jgi:glycosyltransferase involved in cell wall biosynthesis
MIKLAYFVSHPIQYQAPLLRMIAADPDIDLKVFFYSDFSLKPYQDSGFGKVIEWDVPLTEGYEHQFLDCWGSKQWKNIFQQPIAKDITKQLKNGNFDAVWVHGWAWFCSLQVIFAAEKLNIPVLLRGESNGLQETNNFIKKNVKKVFLDFLFKKISAFLYVGNLNYQFYRNHKINADRLFPVPYAVDNNFFQIQVKAARTNRDNLKRSLNLESNRPIILYAAKLIDVKCPQDLLSAYRLLSPDGIQEPEPYLLFVGDGALKACLENTAKETSWQSIRFLGFKNQSEMPAMYDLCDTFVLPSSFEPWGLAINEVMNAGKAVVVSDQVGCAPDLVLDGQNGTIFPVGDVVALAQSIKWAIANSTVAGTKSRDIISNWSFQEDLQGLRKSLHSLIKI